MAAGGYEGKPAAVNWRTGSGEGDVGHYYWKTMVNAEAFTDIKVQFEMLYNYNSYTTYNVEYSLDDETYTKVGSVTMNGVKNWTFCQVELPAEANNQSKLFVRWTPDKTSSIDGSSSANDGNSITNVYFTGTAKLVDDGIAPVLVSSVPAEGATGASANGKVVLTFDEKVKVAEGATATLADLTLAPIVSGKTIIFEYKGLDYSTDYTFRLPANSVSDLTDNYITNEIVINFSTLMKPKVEKKAYDFVVPDDGAFEQAIAAANARADKTVRYRIFVKKGAYSLPASAEASFVGADGKNYPDVRHYITASNISRSAWRTSPSRVVFLTLADVTLPFRTEAPRASTRMYVSMVIRTLGPATTTMVSTTSRVVVCVDVLTTSAVRAMPSSMRSTS